MLVSCVDTEERANTATGNFEALWQIIDEHYCFFDYKQHEYGLDWQEIYNKYRVRISDKMSETQLFEVLTNMLSELRDGHVNLSYSMDYGRYWAWHEGYPKNFSDTLERRYMGTDYKISAGINYRVLDDNIGYIRYESFSVPVGEGNLDDVLSYLMLCRGLIIDIRDNSGGNLDNAERLAARFTNERLHVGYFQHKTGAGHQDFSTPQPEYLDPSTGIRWQKRAVVLTNRHCYSATNTCVRDLKYCPLVTVIGDQTGGGSGMPYSSELPNGWTVRFSACPMFDAEMNQIEFGIQPDSIVLLAETDRARGLDTLIETARQMLNGQ